MIMDDFFSRSEALLGAEAMKALRTKRVIIFGVGGVGSYAAEALIRTGLTHLTIVDGDTVQPSNINRQLPATRATLGMSKVEALKERLLSINPDAEIEAVAEFYHDDDENLKSKILHHQYLIDAIDSVDDKVHLILYASRVRGMKVFSSMGAALRFDPTQVTTGELMTIQGDALAKAVRARMKKIGQHPNKKIRCVYSTEQAQRCETRGSLMQVTATFGLTLASLVIRDLTSQAKL
ncbi:MAG: tRNA threonylcarbamoyladenosine dehydratase [Paludibacteraceae bacterium]|nr:tRNA threonylcarbamoyladenosine dehydratase [Paludibacteraceae bacterium]